MSYIFFIFLVLLLITCLHVKSTSLHDYISKLIYLFDVFKYLTLISVNYVGIYLFF